MCFEFHLIYQLLNIARNHDQIHISAYQLLVANSIFLNILLISSRLVRFLFADVPIHVCVLEEK